MKRALRWALVALALLALAGLGTRAMLARKAASPAPPPVAPAVELAAGDVARAVRAELAATLAVSGGLKRNIGRNAAFCSVSRRRVSSSPLVS